MEFLDLLLKVIDTPAQTAYIDDFYGIVEIWPNDEPPTPPGPTTAQRLRQNKWFSGGVFQGYYLG